MTADILDISIISLILLSTIVGLVMGFFKEFLTLGALLISFALAVIYAEVLSPELPFAQDSELIRWGIAFATIFFGALLVGLTISSLISTVIENIGLGGVDRVLGAVFGFALGVLVITSIVLVLQPSSFSKQVFWQDSRLMPYFEDSAIWVKDSIPDNWNDYVNQYMNKSNPI